MHLSRCNAVRTAGPGALLAILLIVTGCLGISETDLRHLPGYWEIKEVSYPDGNLRGFTANTTIDFFSLEGHTGYRKKVYPRLDGGFDTTDDAVPVEVVVRESRIFLVYTGEDAGWEDELLRLDSNTMLLRDAAGLEYTYGRYEPLNLTGTDGP